MNTRTRIYLAVAVLIAAAIIGSSVWSDHTIRKLENAIQAERQRADASQQAAAAREQETLIYKEKIGYLEAKLADIRTQTRKQDEQLEKLNINSRDARVRVARARGTRTVDTNAGDLCKKLADAAHACEE